MRTLRLLALIPIAVAVACGGGNKQSEPVTPPSGTDTEGGTSASSDAAATPSTDTSAVDSGSSTATAAVDASTASTDTTPVDAGAADAGKKKKKKKAAPSQ